MALFEEHAERGALPPRTILERVIADIDGILAVEPVDSELVQSMVVRMAEAGTLSADRREDFARQAEQAVANQVYPGLRRMRDAAAHRLDEARTTHIGMLGLPDGKAHYRALVPEQTSVAIGPGELHRQAVAEMGRLIGLGWNSNPTSTAFRRPRCRAHLLPARLCENRPGRGLRHRCLPRRGLERRRAAAGYPGAQGQGLG